MSYNLAVLRTLPEADLVAQHDRLAENTQAGISYFLEELARRDQDKQTQEMLRLTQEMHRLTDQMRWMTVVILAATVLSVGLSAAALLR